MGESSDQPFKPNKSLLYLDSQNHSTPIILIRDAYEAIVLTAFFYLLLMYVSHDPEEQQRVFLKAGLSVEADSIAIQKGQDIVKWVFPLGFVKWKPRVRSLCSYLLILF